MKPRDTHIYIMAIFFIFGLAGCTEVELCENDVHPHLAQLAFTYDWNGLENEKPDSMQVIVSRIVNTYHSSFRISSDGAPPEPFIANSVGLKSGEYFMMTFNYTGRLVIQNLDTFLVDNEIGLRDLSMRLKKLEREEIPELGGNTWVDFNPGYSYVSNEGAVFVDKVNNISLFTGVPVIQVFKPKPLTQKINIEFQIVIPPDPVTDQAVTIEDIIAEMSGVATTVNPISEVVGASSLGRFIFRPVNMGHVDSVYTYRGTINAFGLIPGVDVEALSGSGVIRLGVYVGMGKRKKIVRVSANLSKKISETGLMKLSEGGNGVMKAKEEATIIVEQRLKIKPETITEDSPDGVSGWHVDTFIDLDV